MDTSIQFSYVLNDITGSLVFISSTLQVETFLNLVCVFGDLCCMYFFHHEMPTHKFKKEQMLCLIDSGSVFLQKNIGILYEAICVSLIRRNTLSLQNTKALTLYGCGGCNILVWARSHCAGAQNYNYAF